jgi:hypothetical protein
MQYAAPLAIQKMIEKKCQCRPIPRFLWPGKATQDENDSSSSRAIHTLFSKSGGNSFFVNFIHSVPGVAWSCLVLNICIKNFIKPYAEIHYKIVIKRSQLY